MTSVKPKPVPKVEAATNPSEIARLLAEDDYVPDGMNIENDAPETPEQTISRLEREKAVLSGEIAYQQKLEQEKRDKPWSNFHRGHLGLKRMEEWQAKLDQPTTDANGNVIPDKTLRDQLEEKGMMILNRHQRRARTRMENDPAPYGSKLPPL